MKNVAELEEKIKSQVDHIFRMYEEHELKMKMFDLAFEWYIKGIHAATEHVKEGSTK